jgi:hypothetical protein
MMAKEVLNSQFSMATLDKQTSDYLHILHGQHSQ